MRRHLLLVVACAAVSLVACGKGAEQAAAPAAAPSSTMAAADSIGVPECDNYVKKYMECVGSKVPEVSRAQYKVAFDAAVASWKQVAATAEGRAGLAAACGKAQAAAAQAM